MNILITGGSGLLGQYLNIELSKSHRIYTLYNSGEGNCINYNSSGLDIRNSEKLLELFTTFKPNIVIHAAAVSNPLIANSLDPKLVYSTNVTATKNIAELCDKFPAKLVYISTDLVYAGYRGPMLKEDAKLIPVSLYAETKLMGEVKIQETFNNFLILRCALLYGIGIGNKRNHFQQMYESLKAGNPVKLFSDQYRTPLSFLEAARIIIKLCDKNVKTEVVNVGGKERVSRVEMGEILCSITGFDNNLIQKISMNDIPDYPAVEDVSLDTSKLKSYGIKQKSIGGSVEEILESQKVKNGWKI